MIPKSSVSLPSLSKLLTAVELRRILFKTRRKNCSISSRVWASPSDTDWVGVVWTGDSAPPGAVDTDPTKKEASVSFSAAPTKCAILGASYSIYVAGGRGGFFCQLSPITNYT